MSTLLICMKKRMSGLLLPAVGSRLGPYFSSRSETSSDPNPDS